MTLTCGFSQARAKRSHPARGFFRKSILIASCVGACSCDACVASSLPRETGDAGVAATNLSLRRHDLFSCAEILPDRVTVLAETVEPAEQIDVTRAQQDLAKAEDELKSAQSEEEVSNDLGKVRRAQARIEVAEAKHS